MIFADQLGNTFHFDNPPKRIISLVPSQTELLFDLGLEDKIVGLTKFCIYPKEKVKQKTVIGGTKNLRFEVIHSLKPDLIIANKEENVKEHIEELQKNYPVWVSNISSVKDAIKMIEDIGKITQTTEKATEISSQIHISLMQRTFTPNIKALYLIWRNPYMAAGSDTFISEMMKLAGFENMCLQPRYPELSVEQMKELEPDFILLSSEPYPFKEKHIQELQNELPKTKIILVDGELFSWYGSRLLKSASYFKQLKNDLN